MILILELHSFPWNNPAVFWILKIYIRDYYPLLRYRYRDLVTKPEYLTKVSESVFEILSYLKEVNVIHNNSVDLVKTFSPLFKVQAINSPFCHGENPGIKCS